MFVPSIAERSVRLQRKPAPITANRYRRRKLLRLIAAPDKAFDSKPEYRRRAAFSHSHWFLIIGMSSQGARLRTPQSTWKLLTASWAVVLAFDDVRRQLADHDLPPRGQAEHAIIDDNEVVEARAGLAQVDVIGEIERFAVHVDDRVPMLFAASDLPTN